MIICEMSSRVDVDEVAVGLLSPEMLTGVVPVRMTGDGNCLFHAVSRALEEANVEHV